MNEMKEWNEIKVGSVVKLKSGGPKMTVEYIDYTGCVECKWFDSTPAQTLFKGRFILDMLEFIDLTK